MNRKRWQRLMKYWNWNENLSEYENLFSLHNEKHRKYHNTDHIEDCLKQLDSIKNIDQKTHFTLELTFWFHDAVYNPFKKNNEFKSAELADRFLKKNEASQKLQKTIWDLILITKHTAAPQSQLQALMMDIDVSILGSDKERYKAYTKQIRKEYKWVPWVIYKNKRKAILSLFLKRQKIYFTEEFFERYEANARTNLKNELALLS